MLEQIRKSGVVGAGGAGFPTAVKLNCKVDTLIINGAECEPLLRVDQQLMAQFAPRLVDTVAKLAAFLGAKTAYIATKTHYHEAMQQLKAAIAQGGHKTIVLRGYPSFYPLGDEQQLVYACTGKVVPVGGLPLDAGAVVMNVATVLGVADALEGRPVTHRYVTVGGAVECPATYHVPIGTPVSLLLQMAGAPTALDGYSVISGGPCMGTIVECLDAPVTKTTSGILVFPSHIPAVAAKTGSLAREMQMARSVCCQCNYCTQMCPRNHLGLKVEPHKAMRTLYEGDLKLLGDASGVFACCDCGICALYACNFGLRPNKIMQNIKKQLIEQGVKPEKKLPFAPDPMLEYKHLPTARLIARLGIKKYDLPAPLTEMPEQPARVCIPLKMHIGAPATPLVKVGDCVQQADLIGQMPQGGLGANVHASISGTVTAVNERQIEIERG